MNKTILRLLALMLCTVLLSGCGSDPEVTESTLPGDSQPGTEESTEETVEGLLGENGKKLTVDYDTPGVIDENAPGIASKQIMVGELTLEMPFAVSALLDAGWTFYSEEHAARTVSPETVAEIMGYDLYLEEKAWMELSRVQNPGTEEAPVSECLVLKLNIETNDLTQDGLEFVLPGGITRHSTAADVIAVFGSIYENDSFDSVTVNSHIIYYYLHCESGLSYYFNFNEDGTLADVSVIVVTE